MTVRVGINGFGRIGRNFLRAVMQADADIEVVAVNDLTSAEVHAQLLRYDSTHGPLRSRVDVDGTDLVVANRRIAVLCERDPAALPWEDFGVEVVIESTGMLPVAFGGERAPEGRRVDRDRDGTVRGRRCHHRHGGERRLLRPGPPPRRLERVVHHQLLRADGEGDRRRLRRSRAG